MKPTAGSHEIVDQAFVRDHGWRRIHETEVRRIMKRINSGEYPNVTGLHLRDHGDFTVDEIKRWTMERRAAKCRP